jgi:hypothetical protein
MRIVCARFVRIVDEVTLGEESRFFRDDLDAVFVGADGAIRAEPVEDRPHNLGWLDREAAVIVDARVGDIVLDADVNPCLGPGCASSSNTALAIAGLKSGRQPVAAADDARHLLPLATGDPCASAATTSR